MALATPNQLYRLNKLGRLEVVPGSTPMTHVDADKAIRRAEGHHVLLVIPGREDQDVRQCEGCGEILTNTEDASTRYGEPCAGVLVGGGVVSDGSQEATPSS